MTIYQIYFHESQLANLEPDYFPYFNEKCSVFFESQVIRDLIESGAHKGSEYFGVVSYKLRSKLAYIKESWKNNKNIANISTNEFTPELFEAEVYKHRPEIMSFQRHAPHDPILVAEQFHPGFRKFWTHIMQKIGYPWTPTHLEDVIYCNYFVAKAHIYDKFVAEMLGPAMDVMVNMPELWNNCPYPAVYPEHLKEQLGVNHFTFHPFLAERMISWFIYIYNYKTLHY